MRHIRVLAITIILMILANSLLACADPDPKNTTPDQRQQALRPEPIPTLAETKLPEYVGETINLEAKEYIVEPEEENTETAAEMNLWEYGYQKYGISYNDTSRMLKLISHEGYWMDETLDYYCACCCVVRCIEDYWGYGNIYSAFGEADTSYGEWMDELGIDDHAYTALWQAYDNLSYVYYCNGMMVPEDYVYYSNGIYVWR